LALPNEKTVEAEMLEREVSHGLRYYFGIARDVPKHPPMDSKIQ